MEKKANTMPVLFSIISPPTSIQPSTLEFNKQNNVVYEKGRKPYNCYSAAIGKPDNGFDNTAINVSVHKAKKKLEKIGFQNPKDIDNSLQVIRKHCVQIWEGKRSSLVEHYTASVSEGNKTFYSTKNGEGPHIIIPNLQVLEEIYPDYTKYEVCKATFESHKNNDAAYSEL